MFLDWKNQYCKNYYTTHSELQIQFNPYQITNGIFHRIRTKNFTICMETQRSQTESNHEKDKQEEESDQAPWLQTVLQECSHQDGGSGAKPETQIHGTGQKAER